MVELKEEKLCQTTGGATTITGTLVDAIVGVARTIYGFGQGLGSSIRRMAEDNLCPLQ